ncbi:MAG: hypothetical protein M3126_10795 [Candidatus Eremiobacteraeota bacterium]|nr:hypothetical protein [Candidatus Eremiobacteraeota bacterium]
MTAEKRTYEGISRQAFSKLRAGLERARVALPAGDSGSISSNGLVGSFTYSESASTLELSIEKFPMLLPKTMIWSAIDGAIVDAKRG